MKLLFVAAFLASGAAAQIVDTSRISGIVQDSSGARVAAASISVRSETTGSVVALLSSNEGAYATPPVPPGDYELKVEANGFSPLIQHLHLEVAQHASRDFTLNVGAANEALEVKGVPPILEADSSALSNERTETAVRNLPLNTRNFAELMGLTAGVINVHTQLTGVLPLAAERGDTSYSVNGLRAEENHFLIDGISNNDNHVGLGLILYPPMDAVQEFRMETSAADARYGHGGGGTVNLVIKSGTAKYHGEVFEFLRNSDLDARNFFDNSKPGFRMNEFGATFEDRCAPAKIRGPSSSPIMRAIAPTRPLLTSRPYPPRPCAAVISRECRNGSTIRHLRRRCRTVDSRDLHSPAISFPPLLWIQ
jgi:hypothetical protein